MEVFRFSILPMEDLERREAFRDAINKCPNCDHVMRFEYSVDYMEFKIEEKAHCSQCHCQIRNETHQIQ